MTELNFVERIGLEVLRRGIDRAESHIHEWSDAELAEIQFERVQHNARADYRRWAVSRSGSHFVHLVYRHQVHLIGVF